MLEESQLEIIDEALIPNGKDYKLELEKAGKIKCGRCRYHRGENATYKKWKSKPKNKNKRDHLIVETDD